MAAPTTWRNIDRPRMGQEIVGIGDASRLMLDGLKGITSAATTHIDNKYNANDDRYEDYMASLSTEDAVLAARKSGDMAQVLDSYGGFYNKDKARVADKNRIATLRADATTDFTHGNTIAQRNVHDLVNQVDAFNAQGETGKAQNLVDANEKAFIDAGTFDEQKANILAAENDKLARDKESDGRTIEKRANAYNATLIADQEASNKAKAALYAEYNTTQDANGNWVFPKDMPAEKAAALQQEANSLNIDDDTHRGDYIAATAAMLKGDPNNPQAREAINNGVLNSKKGDSVVIARNASKLALYEQDPSIAGNVVIQAAKNALTNPEAVASQHAIMMDSLRETEGFQDLIENNDEHYKVNDKSLEYMTKGIKVGGSYIVVPPTVMKTILQTYNKSYTELDESLEERTLNVIKSGNLGGQIEGYVEWQKVVNEFNRQNAESAPGATKKANTSGITDAYAAQATQKQAREAQEAQQKAEQIRQTQAADAALVERAERADRENRAKAAREAEIVAAESSAQTQAIADEEAKAARATNRAKLHENNIYNPNMDSGGSPLDLFKDAGSLISKVPGAIGEGAEMLVDSLRRERDARVLKSTAPSMELNNRKGLIPDPVNTEAVPTANGDALKANLDARSITKNTSIGELSDEDNSAIDKQIMLQRMSPEKAKEIKALYKTGKPEDIVAAVQSLLQVDGMSIDELPRAVRDDFLRSMKMLGLS